MSVGPVLRSEAVRACVYEVGLQHGLPAKESFQQGEHAEAVDAPRDPSGPLMDARQGLLVEEGLHAARHHEPELDVLGGVLLAQGRELAAQVHAVAQRLVAVMGEAPEEGVLREQQAGEELLLRDLDVAEGPDHVQAGGPRGSGTRR